MKKYILASALLIISFWGYSQRYQSIDKLKYHFEYELNYQPDSNDIKSRKSERMLLLIGDSSSIFYSKNEFLRDSIYIANQIWNLSANEKISILENIPKSNFKYRITKNQSSNKLFFEESISRDVFQYQELRELFNWEILDSSKVLLGYNCQKAVTNFGGRSYEAWFTSTIPLNDGPYKFNGLPGFIVSISDTKKHYNFQLVVLKMVKEGEIIAPKATPFKVSKEKFIEKKIESTLFPFRTLERMTGNRSMTFTNGGQTLSAQEMDNLVQAEQRNNNNPIELR